jgi:hypothetical protein
MISLIPYQAHTLRLTLPTLRYPPRTFRSCSLRVHSCHLHHFYCSHCRTHCSRICDCCRHHSTAKDLRLISESQNKLMERKLMQTTPAHVLVAFLIDECLHDVNPWHPDTKETPLHAASHEGHAVVAQLLLENGAYVVPKSEHERTPLHLASMYGHVEVARVREIWRGGGYQESKHILFTSRISFLHAVFKRPSTGVNHCR